MRRIIEQLHHRPWFATVGVYESVKTLVQSKLDGKVPTRAEGLADFFVQRTPLSMLSNGLAVIDVSGVLGRRLSTIEKSCGACDYGDILADIGQARGQGAIGYLFHIDSGGGMATGVMEVASAIAKLEAPTMAFIDGIGASAAYWIACASDLIVASESASVGGIGAIIPWIDSSKLMEFAGLDPQPIVNEGADLKSIGAEPSLTDAQRAYLQNEVNDMGRMFKQFVTSKRPNINNEVFRAGTYIGQRALDLGLVDLIDSMPGVQRLLKAEVDMSQRAKFMAENTNLTPVPAAQTHTIIDPGHSHEIGNPPNVQSNAVYTTTGTAGNISGSSLPILGNVVVAPDFATRTELVAQLDILRAQLTRLEARCQSLESNLQTTQSALAAIPNAEQVKETVDKRFAVHEAARGHGAPIKQPVDGALSPVDMARARTRSNPHVLKALEQIGGRGE